MSARESVLPGAGDLVRPPAAQVLGAVLGPATAREAEVPGCRAVAEAPGEGRDDWHLTLKRAVGSRAVRSPNAGFFPGAGDVQRRLSVTLSVHGLVGCFHISPFNIIHPFVS